MEGPNLPSFDDALKRLNVHLQTGLLSQATCPNPHGEEEGADPANHVVREKNAVRNGLDELKVLRDTIEVIIHADAADMEGRPILMAAFGKDTKDSVGGLERLAMVRTTVEKFQILVKSSNYSVDERLKEEQVAISDATIAQSNGSYRDVDSLNGYSKYKNRHGAVIYFKDGHWRANVEDDTDKFVYRPHHREAAAAPRVKVRDHSSDSMPPEGEWYNEDSSGTCMVKVEGKNSILCYCKIAEGVLREQGQGDAFAAMVEEIKERMINAVPRAPSFPSVPSIPSGPGSPSEPEPQIPKKQSSRRNNMELLKELDDTGAIDVFENVARKLFGKYGPDRDDIVDGVAYEQLIQDCMEYVTQEADQKYLIDLKLEKSLLPAPEDLRRWVAECLDPNQDGVITFQEALLGFRKLVDDIETEDWEMDSKRASLRNASEQS